MPATPFLIEERGAEFAGAERQFNAVTGVEQGRTSFSAIRIAP
jgi:hypothetical protein